MHQRLSEDCTQNNCVDPCRYDCCNNLTINKLVERNINNIDLFVQSGDNTIHNYIMYCRISLKYQGLKSQTFPLYVHSLEKIF